VGKFAFVIPRIRELLHAAPFQPFTIRTSNGREHFVPTADHAAMNPKASRVIVFSDNDGQVQITGLHVTPAMEVDVFDHVWSIEEIVALLD
jgi:hypothetical protein